MGTFCEEGFDCKSSDPSVMGAPGVCTKKAETLIAQEGETCNPTLGPVNGIFYEEDSLARVPTRARWVLQVCTRRMLRLLWRRRVRCATLLWAPGTAYSARRVSLARVPNRARWALQVCARRRLRLLLRRRVRHATLLWARERHILRGGFRLQEFRPERDGRSRCVHEEGRDSCCAGG